MNDQPAPAWVDRFLTDLAEHGYVTRAACAAGVSTTTVLQLCQTEPAFAAKVDGFKATGVEWREFVYRPSRRAHSTLPHISGRRRAETP
jgi:predicted alpha-1,6-mannanase (GH76 family)